MFFFRPRKPRQFTHKPIYWNPEKEEMEKRKQRILQEKEGVTDDISFRKEQIKGRFIQASSHLSKKKRHYSSFGNSFFKGTTISICILIIVLYLLYRR